MIFRFKKACLGRKIHFGIEKYIFPEAGRLKSDAPPRRVLICPKKHPRKEKKRERKKDEAKQTADTKRRTKDAELKPPPSPDLAVRSPKGVVPM